MTRQAASGRWLPLGEGSETTLLEVDADLLDPGRRGVAFRGVTARARCPACGWITSVELGDAEYECHACGAEAHLSDSCPACGSEVPPRQHDPELACPACGRPRLVPAEG
jgi:DNA-directed RNA polymerase subunit RPC12/RpoP